MTDNWYGIPVGVRIFRLVVLLAIIVFMAFIAYRLVTSETEPQWGSRDTNPLTNTIPPETITTETEPRDETGSPPSAPAVQEQAADHRSSLSRTVTANCRDLPIV